MIRLSLATLAALFAANGWAAAGEIALSHDAKAYFVEPQNGAIASIRVEVRNGFSGLGIASTRVEKAETGRYHLLIDGMEIDFVSSLPSDALARRS